MNRDELLALAESCCNPAWGDWFSDEDALIKFASLVAAAERQRMEIDSIHTCHAECQRPACVATRKAVAREREECAKICDEYAQARYAAEAIRERGGK
jgi:hypothetical protein